MNRPTLAQLRARLDAKEISALELAEQYLDRIRATNSQLNSFITVDEEHVRRRAQHAQTEIDGGNQSALTGIPFAAKDVFCTKGVRTTAASKILNDYIPPYSASVIDRLRDSVLLGKTNMDEFAMGSSTEFSAYGVVRNPYDLDRVPGGSSGGSAVAVAAGQAAWALGTDTGGSIRQPASFTNVVGFKPTYGRISRYGVVAMSSSLDTVGFFTNTVADSALILQELAGADPLDATTPDLPVDSYLTGLAERLDTLRIGIPKEYANAEGVSADVKAVFERTIELLSGLGAEIMEVSLPHTQYALPAYYIICPSEVCSNLARYDGIQFGSRATGAKDLDEVFLMTREEGFGPEVKRRIMIGTFCLSSGFYDSYYHKAQQVRALVIEDFQEAFRTVDLLLSPTSPTLPFKIGDRAADPLAMYAADMFTVPSSLAGLPAVSIPVGFMNKLPVAVQLIGPQFGERQLLGAAHALEQAFPANDHEPVL